MSEAATNKKTPIYKVLYFQVICAIVIGIVLGAVWPEVGEKMKPFGDGFIRLIKMIIAPVIFCTVVTGIAGMENMKKVGKTGGLALLYFEVVSTIALIIGLVIVNVVEPGSGMHVDPATLDQSAVSAYTGPGKMQTTTQFLMNVIPSTVVGAFAQGDILQVLFFSILFGFALHKFGGRGTLVFDLIEKSSQILFQIVGMIMRVAPIGAFGAMAFTIGKYGIASLLPLAKLMGTFYATCLLFIFIVLGAICRIHGFSVMRYIAYIKEELLIVLGTSSSESVLPRMMTKMERAGVSRSVVGLVIPTGYSFNLDGTAIYLTMAAVFIAQACDVNMTIMQQVTLLAVLLIAVLFRGLVGRLNILLGVIVGYVYACFRGQVDFSAIGDAAWIGFPKFHLPQVDFSILPMFIPVVLVLVAENVGHVKSVAQMTGRDYDGHMGTALFADGLGTAIAGFGGGSGTTTYGENIGVMAATKVYSTAAYWCAAAFALLLSLCPKFGAVINTIPGGVLGGVTTLLYGMIGMIGVRIWVENKVNFDKPLNIMVAAIVMIIGIADFTFAFQGVQFNGIAIGTVVILVAYHGLKAIGKVTGTIDRDDPDIL